METVVITLVVICVGIFLIGSRHSWVRRQCPACRLFVPAQATKCCHCHSSLPPREASVTVPVLLAGLVAGGQVQAMDVAECVRPTFFAEVECVEVAPVLVPLSPSPAAPPVPLFTKESVSPHTPPELLDLSNDRTMAKARAYVRRQIERNQATEEVVQLVQRAWQDAGVLRVP